MEPRRPRGRVVKATTPASTSLHPNHPPQPVSGALEQPIVTATMETARPQKPEPKSTAAPNGLLGSLRRKQPRVSKPRPPHPQHPTWWSPPKFPTPHSSKSQISSITSRSMHVWSLLFGSSRRSLPSPQRAARPHAVLKTEILFAAEYGSTP